MLSVLYGATRSSREDFRQSWEKLAGVMSNEFWSTTGRWFDFQFPTEVGGDVEVVEDGKPIGRITSLDEARSFVGWVMGW